VINVVLIVMRRVNSVEVLSRLQSMSNRENVAGMVRFGINPKNTYGISIPDLRRIAKELRRNHGLALELWRSGIHEARILASMIDDPQKVTSSQMEQWVRDFDSWDVCDQCCSNLFEKTALASRKAVEWSSRKEEFVKRAAFALIAALAVHDRTLDDAQFKRFLKIISVQSNDERNLVKKAVNWALRQIGKRSSGLNRAAIATAKKIQQHPSKAAHWIAADALRELTSLAVQQRLSNRTRQRGNDSGPSRWIRSLIGLLQFCQSEISTPTSRVSPYALKHFMKILTPAPNFGRRAFDHDSQKSGGCPSFSSTGLESPIIATHAFDQSLNSLHYSSAIHCQNPWTGWNR
jgi:3-methyladenine DNA glycosylase AlkD